VREITLVRRARRDFPLSSEGRAESDRKALLSRTAGRPAPAHHGEHTLPFSALSTANPGRGIRHAGWRRKTGLRRGEERS